MGDKIYTVGEMARICNISSSQLRYYDNLGVIKPAYRNPQNGYRYYTEQQIEPLIFLYDLKKIGISNDSIQRLFINRDEDQLVQELKINLAQAEQELQQAYHKYRSISDALVENTMALSYLHGDEAMSSQYANFKINLIRFPVCQILSTRYCSNWHIDNKTEYTRRIVELNQLADTLHIPTADTKLSIYHHGATAQFSSDPAEQMGDYEVAKRVKNDALIEHSKHIRTIGGFSAVCTIYVGAPSGKSWAYEVTKTWSADHNLHLSDTSLEEHLVDFFSSTDQRRFVTKIYIPLKNEQI